MTISFHVDDKNNIKSYIYWSGQTQRFIPADIVQILPCIFSSRLKKKVPPIPIKIKWFEYNRMLRYCLWQNRPASYDAMAKNKDSPIFKILTAIELHTNNNPDPIESRRDLINMLKEIKYDAERGTNYYEHYKDYIEQQTCIFDEFTRMLQEIGWKLPLPSKTKSDPKFRSIMDIINEETRYMPSHIVNVQRFLEVLNKNQYARDRDEEMQRFIDEGCGVEKEKEKSPELARTEEKQKPELPLQRELEQEPVPGLPIKPGPRIEMDSESENRRMSIVNEDEDEDQNVNNHGMNSKVSVAEDPVVEEKRDPFYTSAPFWIVAGLGIVISIVYFSRTKQ